MYIFRAFCRFCKYYFNFNIPSCYSATYTGIEMKLIATVIIGGASLNGGKDSILGAMLGLIILVLISML